MKFTWGPNKAYKRGVVLVELGEESLANEIPFPSFLTPTAAPELFLQEPCVRPSMEATCPL